MKRLMALGSAVLAVALFSGCASQQTGPSKDVDSAAWAETFEGWGAAMAAGDIDGLASGFADDAVRINPLAGTLEGKQAQRDFIQMLYDNFDNQEIVVHNHSAQGNTVFLELTWTARHKQSGKVINLDEVQVLEMNSAGKIAQQKQYFDSASFNKQME
ncbi:MAG: nuclear transport factor 2 family protein [Betaproteobacteria bacterium]|nr:MAG: nuclear transport factor 2 family protein [Betaproteobacteria bacterium]